MPNPSRSPSARSNASAYSGEPEGRSRTLTRPSASKYASSGQGTDPNAIGASPSSNRARTAGGPASSIAEGTSRPGPPEEHAASTNSQAIDRCEPTSDILKLRKAGPSLARTPFRRQTRHGLAHPPSRRGAERNFVRGEEHHE